MKTVILPGYSPHNRDWAEEVAKKLHLGHEVMVHYWKHWKMGGSLSFKYEIEKIIEKVGNDELNFIAKSVGTGVLAQFLMRKTNKINKMILCGIPSIRPENAEMFRRAFEDIPAGNIVVFQNIKDPFATYEEVKEFVGGVNPDIKVIGKPAHTHDYPYSEDFEKFLK